MYQDATYNVWLTVVSGRCRDSVMREIPVLARPRADFRPPPPFPGEYFHPAPPLEMINLIQPPDRDSLTYQWTWAHQGGANAATFSREPVPAALGILEWGDFDITQRVAAPNGKCFSETTRTITILAPPVFPNFDDVHPICLSQSIQFVNTSRNARAYVWDFGDGVKSSDEEPRYTYLRPGTYTVSLTAIGDHPVPQTVRKTVVVHPTPLAGFDVNARYLYVGLPLEPANYTSTTTNAGDEFDVWYRWDWGDGTPYDTVRSPVHMYRRAGDFTITLTVGTYTEPQCSTSFTMKDAITMESPGEILLPNVFRPKTDGEPDDVIPDRGYMNYLFYPPLMSPVRKYSMTIVSRWGQIVYQTTDPTRGWNGYFRGRLCDEGLYYYRIEGIYENGQPFMKIGDVVLLR